MLRNQSSFVKNTPDEIFKIIQSLEFEKRAFINGEFVEACKGQVIVKSSPVNGFDLSGISACDQYDVDIAVAAAKQSYESKVWVSKKPNEKREILLKLAQLMEDSREELALLDCIETGRSINNYYFDSIPKAIESLRWFANAVDKTFDHAIQPRANEFATVTKEPLGIVGLITPWNDPLVVAIWKLAPALLMGNSVVVKPAEQSSLSILKVAKLAKKAGVPSGVLNIVPGYGESAGKALALHPDVNGIFFTGSSFVGKKILEYSGQSNMKKVGLECGGKSAFIVSKNCKNIAHSAAVLAQNIFYNQGQICSAPSRLIIQSEVKENFLKLFVKEAEKYIPGNPLDINCKVGGVVSYEQKEKIEKYIANAKNSSATVIEVSPEKRKCQPDNCSVFPIIFDDVEVESELAQEEIFGPVLAVIEVSSLSQAVKVANNSKYGLAASIWTNDFDEAYNVSQSLRVGIVHINSYGDDDESVPFGGAKESGIGKDKSVYAFEEYSNTKTIWSHFNIS